MYSKYKWMFPTIQQVNKATLRYDVEPLVDLDDQEIAETFVLLMELFGPMIDKCRVLKPDEVRLNKQSSSGPNYEFAKLKTGGLFERYYNEFIACWKFAHKLGLPMYWKASGKVEILPEKKVEAGDCRTFLFPDSPHRFSGQMMCQDFNIKMGELKDHWSKIGFDRTHGGFTALGNELSSLWDVFWEGDVTKWDARMVRLGLAICMFLRWVCYEPRYRTPKNWNRLVYQYTNKAKSLVFLPTGQLVLIGHGNKSGQDSTSYDNTIFHIFIYLYESRRTIAQMGIHPSLQNICARIMPNLYGDDSLGGMRDDLHQFICTTTGDLPTWLDRMYTRWGMLFKRGECKVQSTIEGLKFIGGIFKWTHYGWAHTFSMPRVRAAMARDVENLSLEEQWAKWTSLLALSTFEDERHHIREFMQRHASSRKTGPTFIPRDHDLYAFWFGWESPTAFPLSDLKSPF